jgi:hypothetical protein
MKLGKVYLHFYDYDLCLQPACLKLNLIRVHRRISYSCNFSKKIGAVFRSNRAIYSNMKNRLFLILTTLITLTLLMASCLQIVPSTPEESAIPAPRSVVEIPPAAQATPNWVYAIIGIGAALAVVVTVYIFRSRRS